MIRKPIRNLHTSMNLPPRFCDVIVDGGKVYLEQKIGKDKLLIIPWDDVVHQVNVAIEVDREKLPQTAP